jgi:predicted Zn-dependent protease
VVFCRNTLLYFGRGYIEAAETVLFDALAPGGWLILGQSEAVRTQRHRWMLHVVAGTTLYQKSSTVSDRMAASLLVTPAEHHIDSYAAALHAVHHNQVIEAERALHDLLTQQNDRVQIHLLLAYILASRSETASAHQHLNTVLQLDPMQADAHYLRATLYLEIDDLDAADRALRAALYCQRDHPLAAFLLGNLYYKTGDRVRALRLWESAQRVVSTLQPDSWFSDFSEMSAANFANLIRSQIEAASNA